jgi:prepilin-type N-terminal cleavage/methylation domain-containing protein
MKVQKKGFTLIELMAAMGVFSIIMLILISFFISAQNIWNLTRQKNTMYENARIALDLIARDIQCIYYEQEKIPFYHHPGSAADNDTEALYFISTTNCLPNYDCNTRLCEIAYKFYNIDDPPAPAKPTNARAGALVRSVTGDAQSTTNTAWNYYGKPSESVGVENPPLGKIYHATDDTYAFTRESYSAGVKCSRDVFNTVIPYVVNLSYVCFKKDGTVIDTVSDANKKMIPYSIMIELTLLDRESWLKWKAVGSSPTDQLLLNNRRVFSRTVLIGERGQKY